MGDPVTMMLVGGTALNAVGSIQEGKAADKAAQFEAAQLEEQAKARYAQGTREAYESRRVGRIMESDARAAMAAGGGSTTDAGAIEQLGKISAESDYESLAALYEGETAAAGLKKKAWARRKEGRAARRAGRTRALSTVITGGAAAYASYNKPPPPVYGDAFMPGRIKR